LRRWLRQRKWFQTPSRCLQCSGMIYGGNGENMATRGMLFESQRMAGLQPQQRHQSQ
jgi:hypothetical protein